MTEIGNDRFNIQCRNLRKSNCSVGTVWTPCFSFKNFSMGEHDSIFHFPFAAADTFKDQTLSQDDVPNVVCEILDIQTMFMTFGRVLGLPKVTLDSIHQRHSDPQECLFGVLDEFVKQVEPPPTWRLILEALRHPLIRHYRLAQEIESKYCPRLPTDDDDYAYSVSQSVHELFVTSLAEPRPVQKSGDTVATTAPVSVESSDTIPPGIAYLVR